MSWETHKNVTDVGSKVGNEIMQQYACLFLSMFSPGSQTIGGPVLVTDILEHYLRIIYSQAQQKQRDTGA
jgi:hypothetical protein